MISIREETYLVCQHCGHDFDRRHFNGFCSMLGPALVHCPKCRQPTPTDRSEWADMGWAGRAWYVVASLIYVLVMTFFGMTSGWCTLYFGFAAFGKKLGDSLATALPGAIVWGGLTAIIQVARVWGSLSRKPGEPVDLPFRNLVLGLQTKLMSAVFAVPIAVGLLSLPVRWLVVGWGR